MKMLFWYNLRLDSPLIIGFLLASVQLFSSASSASSRLHLHAGPNVRLSSKKKHQLRRHGEVTRVDAALQRP